METHAFYTPLLMGLYVVIMCVVWFGTKRVYPQHWLLTRLVILSAIHGMNCVLLGQQVLHDTMADASVLVAGFILAVWAGVCFVYDITNTWQCIKSWPGWSIAVSLLHLRSRKR
jgi:hypothetical protein